MTRAARTRFALLAVVAVLAALALWQWHHDAARAPGTLLSTPPAAIDRITLTLGNAPPRQYLRRDGHWWHADGSRADDRYVDGLAGVAAAPVLEWRTLREFSPAKIGLAPPQSTLTLGSTTVRFGAMSATGPQCYVQVGDRIALVSLRWQPRAPEPEHVRLH